VKTILHSFGGHGVECHYIGDISLHVRGNNKHIFIIKWKKLGKFGRYSKLSKVIVLAEINLMIIKSSYCFCQLNSIKEELGKTGFLPQSFSGPV